ncbi:MAG: hypothetical protein IT550_14225 [Novosphingobium sp.]|jgi:hypothetical protein|nr:hypothetical protein [Novosphingobium sp.]
MTVAGTYEITTKTPLGDQNGTLTIAVNGDTFSGTVANPLMGSMAITGGTVTGNRLAWKMDMKVPMPMSLDCEATVDGDVLEGQIRTAAFGAMAIKGTRVG